MLESLAEATVVISGGGGGMGRAAALRFGAARARVGVIDRNEAALAAVAAELAASGADSACATADVSDAGEVERAAAKLERALGPADVLFNHAGAAIVRPFLETTVEEWDRMMTVNLRSMFLTCRTVLPGMLGRGCGAIVNMASISGLTASPLESAYCVSKAAVIQLTRAIAVEFRDRGIRCNCICPGFVRTAHGLREIEQLRGLGLASVDNDIEAR
jgi:NAD(P)-dependent dehydrogenase (short-subunit alcohol dehydrogenase family)